MIRKARIEEAQSIMELVNRFASRELMLPRSLYDTYENLRDFYVAERDGEIVGCAALHVTWNRLMEIRSLAVRDDAQGEGLGSTLVEKCLEEAREMGAERVFVLTFIPGYFRQFGFRDHPKEKLPHKVWSDCMKCPHFPNCDEEAMILDLDGE